jgi:hypothetical protein
VSHQWTNRYNEIFIKENVLVAQFKATQEPTHRIRQQTTVAILLQWMQWEQYRR